MRVVVPNQLTIPRSIVVVIVIVVVVVVVVGDVVGDAVVIDDVMTCGVLGDVLALTRPARETL